MLSFIRTVFGKWFLIIIVAGISMVFVLWGVFPGSGRVGGGGTEVASIGGEAITLQELNQAYKRNLEMYQQMSPELPEQLIQSLKQQTLQGLVQQKLMVIEAERLGISASDAEVMAEIQKIPVFHDKVTNKFDRNRYVSVLAQNNLTPGQFEASVRGSVSQERLMKFLEARIRITDEELRREFRLTSDQRELEFVRFSRTEAAKKVSVPAKEIDQLLADPAKQPMIQNFYTQNRHLYNREETVCARHILVRFGKEEKNKDTPPKLFLDIKPTAANFAKLADKHSQDPGTKGKGGDLGCFNRSVMDKKFEEVAFSIPVNQVSKPVKTAFGWHYILKYKTNPPMHKTLEQARREIAEDMIKRENVAETSRILRQEAEAVAKRWPPTSPRPLSTGLFNRLDTLVPKIGRADEIAKAAFNPAAPIQNKPQIFEAQGGVIVAKVKVAKKPNMDEFQKNRKVQYDTLKARKLRTFMPAWMDDVRTRVKVSFNEKALSNF